MRVSILAAAGVALAFLGEAPRAGAQDLLTYDVAWEREAGAESCPDRAAFVTAIEQRVIANRLQAGSSRKLDVRLSRGANEWHAELRVVEHGVVKGSQELEFAGAACSGLFNALVAIAAVTLGEAPPEAVPEKKAKPAEKEPGPQPEPPPTPPVDPASWPTIYEPLSAPEDDEPDSRRHRRWTGATLTFELAQDFMYTKGKTDACDRSCLEGDSPFGGRAAPGVDNRVSEGLLLGNVRFLGGLQLNVSEWAVFELRAGGVISRFQTQSLPFHFDTGFRCWLADRSAPVRPFLSTGLGAAEYDAIFRVTVVDCLNADSALSEACRSGGAAGTRKELVGAERLSFFFAAARIGAAWYFAETQMLSLGLSAIVTFPEQTGFVFQPALGYGGEL